MAQLLCALEDGREPEISGVDNLRTMALVDACYLSVRQRRAVALRELLRPKKPGKR
jgi:predicted dehydrogenase